MSALSRKDYEKAKQMWRSGDFTLVEIAQRFNITDSALWRRFDRDGVKKGEDAHAISNALKQSLQGKAAEKAPDLLGAAVEAKELHMKTHVMLTRRMLQLYKQNEERGRPPAAIGQDMKVLAEMSRIAKVNYDSIAKILHLDREADDESDIPSLVVQTLTEQDVLDMRREQTAQLNKLWDDEELGENPDEDLDDLGVIEE